MSLINMIKKKKNELKNGNGIEKYKQRKKLYNRKKYMMEMTI
jgi:hypothetical protein